MAVSPIREEFFQVINTLSDEQVAALLHVVKAMQSSQVSEKEPYDESQDLTVGLISGTTVTNIAEHAEDILYGDASIPNVWTWQK